MCGRYTLIRLADFTDMFPWIRAPQSHPPPRYNIAPTQPVVAVTNDGKDQISYLHWGLVPAWAKDPSIGPKLINARSETAASKPAFRTAFKRRRCLIPASGFYEWKRTPGGGKVPMFITRRDKRPFAFAGLWDTWQSPDGSALQTCTILTSHPNSVVAQIHDRMAVILQDTSYRAWLDASTTTDDLTGLLHPCPAELIEAYPVSRSVNSPKNDDPTLIEPLPDDGAAVSSLSPGSRGKGRRKGKDSSDQPSLF